MALLLRMAGIPARVATGFSTGATGHQDRRVRRARLRRALLGRGLLPGLRLGHVRPDARRLAAARQPPRRRSGPSVGSGRRRRASAATAPSERGAGVAVAAERAPWWQYALIGVGALVAARARPPRWCAAGAGARRPPRALGELERALRARAASRPPGRRCTRSSCASPARPPPPATCARCASRATATRPPRRPARSAAACGPSSDAAAACSAPARVVGAAAAGSARRWPRGHLRTR